MWIFWLITCGAFFILEMMTAGFLVFWLGIGALAAMCVSFIASSIVIQTAVFVVISTILIFLTKPLINKYVMQKETVPTNAYSIIGKNGIVSSEIKSPDGVGIVKIGGETWSAISSNGESIPKGTEVTVEKIDGVKVIVTPLHVLV